MISVMIIISKQDDDHDFDNDYDDHDDLYMMITTYHQSEVPIVIIHSGTRSPAVKPLPFFP